MTENILKPTIVVDTREQLPYSFSQRVDVVHAALPAGDYSLLGFEREIAIERKSLDDFIKTVIHARDRFKAELKKLAAYNVRCVIVEADISAIVNHHYTGNVHPNSLLGAAHSIFIDHAVPVFFLSNRQIACQTVEDYLLRYFKKATTICPQKDPNDTNEPAQNKKRKRLPDELLPAELRINEPWK